MPTSLMWKLLMEKQNVATAHRLCPPYQTRLKQESSPHLSNLQAARDRKRVPARSRLSAQSAQPSRCMRSFSHACWHRWPGIYGRLCCKPRGRGGGWTVLLNACETANGWRTRKNKWREMPYHRPPMRDDARAHDSAELTGIDCGDGEAGWRPERGWAEADRSSLCCYCYCC